MSDESSDTERQEMDEEEQAKEQIRRLEEDPPESLEDWPQGKAKYETYGGPEGDHGYHEGPEQKLGPSSLRHHEGGEVSIAGEKVDNPEEYKGEPIPGGPTDPSVQGGSEASAEEGESPSGDEEGEDQEG